MIFVAGFHASGKSELAKQSTERFNTLHVETSVIVRQFKEQDDPDNSMREWAREKEEIYGSNFFDELIVHTIRERYDKAVESGDTPQDIIITGNRSLEGIKYSALHLSDLIDRPSLIVAVHTEPEQLYERYRLRNRRPGDAEMTFEAFRDLMREEEEAGIRDIFEYADHIIDNNGTEQDFLNTTEYLLTHEFGLELRAEGEDITIHREGRSRRKTTGY